MGAADQPSSPLARCTRTQGLQDFGLQLVLGVSTTECLVYITLDHDHEEIVANYLGRRSLMLLPCNFFPVDFASVPQTVFRSRNPVARSRSWSEPAEVISDHG